MKNRLLLTLAVSSLAALALAGCSSSDTAASGTSSSDTSAAAPAASDAAPAAPASGSEAAVADSSLGKIVVDGKGMTAYFYDKDTANSGKSACVDACVALWPAITSASDAPKVDGITGKVGTIAASDGTKQITINGRPIYTFAKDMAAGDVNGQGTLGVWYVVSPSGDEIKDAAGAATSGGPAAGY